MHFCLSFLSIFIVVTGILVINTLIEHGPMIFLKLAEGDIGQYDAVLYPIKTAKIRTKTLSNFRSDGNFINFTAV